VTTDVFIIWESNLSHHFFSEGQTIIFTIQFKPCTMVPFHVSNFVSIHLQCQFLLPFIAWQLFILDPACKPFLHSLSSFRLFRTVNNDRCFYSVDTR